jgi:dTDP-4-amino-4,6-dideoxygalactose transaminase
LKSWNTQRNHISNQYDKYFKEFERFEKIKIVRSEQLNEPARHLYPIRVMKDRDKIIQKLRLKGIECLVHYPTPLNKISWLKNSSTNHKLPIATEVSKQLISLPLFPGMSEI